MLTLMHPGDPAVQSPHQYSSQAWFPYLVLSSLTLAYPAYDKTVTFHEGMLLARSVVMMARAAQSASLVWASAGTILEHWSRISGRFSTADNPVLQHRPSPAQPKELARNCCHLHRIRYPLPACQGIGTSAVSNRGGQIPFPHPFTHQDDGCCTGFICGKCSRSSSFRLDKARPNLPSLIPAAFTPSTAESTASYASLPPASDQTMS